MAAQDKPQDAREPKRISVKEALMIAQRHERRKEFDQARALYVAILRGFPDNAQARARLAALGPATNAPAHDRSDDLLPSLHMMFKERRFAEVEAAARTALETRPGSFALLTLLGAVCFELGRFTDAEQNARAANTLRPNEAAACFNLANALRMQDKTDESASLYRRALKLDPRFTVAHNHLALLLLKMEQTDKALEHWQAALAIDPRMKDALLGCGLCAAQDGRYDDAMRWYEQAIAIDPDFTDAHNNMGNVLFAQDKKELALKSFERALALNPALDNAYSYKFWMHRQWCDFTAQAALEVRETLDVFDGMTVEDNPARQQRSAAAQWKKIAGMITPLALPQRVRRPGEPIRIGYFSADFHNHATMQLMSGVLREHDRSRFEIHAFNYGSHKHEEIRDFLNKCNLSFHDVEVLNDREIADLARKTEIDIALDLNGYTANTRSRMFAHRLAPVQMNYLAFPGTMGTDVFDYIVADKRVIPDEYRRFYSEKVLYLPHSYQPNDNLRPIDPIPTTRKDHGLPASGFVFCCFNATHKISAEEYDIWMRLLSKVEGSVLWLLSTDEIVKRNLRRETALRGIGADRIIFASKIAHPLHLERHRHADLFLDTFNYNAHTTTSDALWAGLPVVTRVGKQFAARVAASLLSAMDLPDMITSTSEEYEAKILDLARHPQKLREAHERLARIRRSAPLYDTRRYTRNLERGFELAIERHTDGLPPADITVQDTLAAL